MKNVSFIIIITMIFHTTTRAQSVYVDFNTGNDKNPGTKEAPLFSIQKAAEIIKSNDNDKYIIKINPGIYVLDNHITVETEKKITDKRIVIEASILPGDSSWTPEKMPVITSRAMKGEIPGLQHWVVSFLIEESHVTIRGIKFHGYFYPHTRYFPVARINKAKTDLLVQQCMFVGDANISQIQAGVVAHGNEVKIDHCIFYKLRNTVVFFLNSGDGPKTGNGITNSLIYGTSQAVWTVAPDKDFTFENNVVSGCRYVWAKNDFNKAEYTITNCILDNNRYYTGIADTMRLNPRKFNINEHNVTKKNKISLRLTGNDNKPLLFGVDEPLPVDYMHIIPNITYDMEAGLFKRDEK